MTHNVAGTWLTKFSERVLYRIVPLFAKNAFCLTRRTIKSNFLLHKTELFGPLYLIAPSQNRQSFVRFEQMGDIQKTKGKSKPRRILIRKRQNNIGDTAMH